MVASHRPAAVQRSVNRIIPIVGLAYDGNDSVEVDVCGPIMNYFRNGNVFLPVVSIFLRNVFEVLQ